MSTSDDATPPGFFRDWLGRCREPISLFTLFLVIVGALQWCTLQNTDETLRIAQRAWLTTIGVRLITPPIKDQSIFFAILITNSGREPATGVNIKIQNGTIEGINTREFDMATVEVAANTSCVGHKPAPGTAVISPTGIGTSVAITGGSAIGEPRMVTDDKILSGDKFYVLRGCIAYLTQDKERRSSFCYILFSRINNANNQRQYEFMTCRTGFEST
jgi:hypothetical protein